MKLRAFTQIELLVVIGIIVLLTSIIIPALGLSRRYAQALHCSSNIKQHTLSLITYDLNNGYFPYSHFWGIGNQTLPPGGNLGNAVYDEPGWRWHNYIIDKESPEITEESVFWCPSRRIEGLMFKKNILIANYGVNESICKSWMYNDDKQSKFTGPPLSSTDIHFPDKSLLIVDSGYSVINWYHVTDSPPTPLGKSIANRSYLPGLKMNNERNLLDVQKEDAINGRHLNKSVNIGYVGGNVSREKAEDLLVEKTSEGYKNLTPLWLPQKK